MQVFIKKYDIKNAWVMLMKIFGIFGIQWDNYYIIHCIMYLCIFSKKFNKTIFSTTKHKLQPISVTEMETLVAFK